MTLDQFLIARGLTRKEAAVSKLVSQGLSNNEIGGELKCSPNTVKTHLNRIFKKLELKTRANLIVWCLTHSKRGLNGN